jgi:transcriptional regulator with XRE-family HTH domain
MDVSFSAQVLASNLAKLMEYYGHTQEQTAKLAKVDQSVISRILKGEHHPRVDTVEAIALGYDLQAWTLLLPGLDPRNPPVIAMTESERDLYWRLQHDLRKLVERGPESPPGTPHPDTDSPSSERRPPRSKTRP